MCVFYLETFKGLFGITIFKIFLDLALSLFLDLFGSGCGEEKKDPSQLVVAVIATMFVGAYNFVSLIPDKGWLFISTFCKLTVEAIFFVSFSF